MTEIQVQAQSVLKSLRQAVTAALETKRRLNQYAVVLRNGKPHRLLPWEMDQINLGANKLMDHESGVAEK